MINSVKKDIWVNSYPIFLWLALEPIVGLIDSKIASTINLCLLYTSDAADDTPV